MMAGVRYRAAGADAGTGGSGSTLRPPPAASGASPSECPRCRWPLLPGFFKDDPAPARKAWLTCSYDRMLNGACLLLHGVTQLASLLAWSSLPGNERFQRVLSIIVCLSLFLMPCFAPSWYIRRRQAVLVCFRFVFFAFPLLRKARGIQKVLDDAPQPGARGLVKDMLKLAWGSRLMAVVMATMLNPLPLLPLVPHLLLQVYSVAMVRANSSICAAPMLTHPLMKRRIRSFHRGMHLLAFVLPGGVGQSMFPLLDRSSRPEAECEAFLTLFQLAVGLLMPMLVLVKTEPPHSLRAWEEACAEREISAAGAGGGGGGGGGGGSGSGSGSLRQPRQRGLLANLEHAVEAAVRALCGSSWLAPAQPTDDERASLMALRRELTGQRPRHPLRLRLQGWECLVAWWLLVSCSWALSVAVSAY